LILNHIYAPGPIKLIGLTTDGGVDESRKRLIGDRDRAIENPKTGIKGFTASLPEVGWKAKVGLIKVERGCKDTVA
jgi:hypothetical protein